MPVFYLLAKVPDVCTRCKDGRNPPKKYFGNPLSGNSLLWVGRNGSILPRSALAIGLLRAYRNADAKHGRRRGWDQASKPSKMPSLTVAVETTRLERVLCAKIERT